MLIWGRRSNTSFQLLQRRGRSKWDEGRHKEHADGAIRLTCGKPGVGAYTVSRNSECTHARAHINTHTCVHIYKLTNRNAYLQSFI